MSEDDGTVPFAMSKDNSTVSFAEFRASLRGDAIVGSSEEAFCRFSEEFSTEENGFNTVFYLLFAAALVFFMQAGFAMLCAGSVRQESVPSVLAGHLLAACGAALGFWSVGSAISNSRLMGFQSNDTEGFIGNSDFFLNNLTSSDDLIGRFFQFAFAATAATIVAGTVAERCKLGAYLCYSIMLTGFVYPVVVHSIWSSSGFLSAFNDGPLFGVGMIDFAGSGVVVHMTGGLTALIASLILGPRMGRFHDGWGNELYEPTSFPPHSVALQVLGTFILWVGWYGFNPGSTLMITGLEQNATGDVAALCAVTTTIAAAAGCVSAMFTDTILYRRSTGDTATNTMAMNGALSGLVGITAGCSIVAPWASFVIGIVAGVTYVFWSNLLVKLKIDDAVDAIPVHFANGIWGCIAVGLFAEPSLMAKAGFNVKNSGLIYGGSLLEGQMMGIGFIGMWIMSTMAPTFTFLICFNMFRVDSEEEAIQDIHQKEAETANLVLYSQAMPGR